MEGKIWGSVQESIWLTSFSLEGERRELGRLKLMSMVLFILKMAQLLLVVFYEMSMESEFLIFLGALGNVRFCLRNCGRSMICCFTFGTLDTGKQ
ncbi:hypothetical protein V6N12_018271 [Hibiscus sabdariffa]|uniref:Uncharacterized protein n=1 Tax=Hibiscus sabdariffa TaxID=183260 RepID=A0ABR2BRF4_9ROSI